MLQTMLPSGPIFPPVSRALAALPSYLVEDDVAAGRLVSVLPDWTNETMPFALVYPSKQQPSQAITKFIDFTLQHFAALKVH